jgi:hypothetical protein
MSAVKRSSRVASEAKTIVTILNTLLLGKAMSGPLLGKALGEVSPVNKNEASAQRESSTDSIGAVPLLLMAGNIEQAYNKQGSEDENLGDSLN